MVCHCATLKSTLPINLLSQAYLQGNSTIDKIPQIGINITSSIFTSNGYNTDSLEKLQSLSAIENINSYLIDLYWNGSSWDICPQEKLSILDETECEITFQQVLESLSYNTTVANQVGGLFTIFLNLHSNNDTVVTNDWISDILRKTFGKMLFTPSMYSMRNHTYPLYHNSSSSDDWKVVAIYFNNSVLFMSLNESAIFQNNINDFKYNYYSNPFSGTGLSLTDDLIFLNESSNLNEFAKRNSLSWKFTSVNSSISTNLTYLREIMLNGLTSIINIDYQNGFNYSSLNQVSWGWQLDANLATIDRFQFSNEEDTSEFPDAYYCAVYFNGGWYVDNCYKQHTVVCQSLINAYVWTALSPKGSKSYFGAANACDSINNVDIDNSNNNNDNNSYNPSEPYNFSLPINAVQLNSLRLYLLSQNISGPVWIDYNDIDVKDCWIPGGPDELCPLVEINQTKRLIGIGVPLAVFIIFVFSLMIITSSQKVPVQKNRKYWRNLLNDLSMEEYEGVPK